MDFPLIIIDGCDVSFYNNITIVTEDLEWIDVKGGIYRGYDYTGHPLSLTLDIRCNVQVTLDLTKPNSLNELCNHIKDCLVRYHKGENIPDEPEQILKMAMGFYNVYG